MSTPNAASFLEAGLKHMQDRAITYDQPEGERSMGMTMAMASILLAEKLKEPLSEEDGWNIMELLKLVRSKQGAFKADSYEDRAAYAGLAGEAAARDRQKPGLPSEKAAAALLVARAEGRAYIAWPGSDRPFSGLVECLTREGKEFTADASGVDWVTDEATPLGSDVIGWRQPALEWPIVEPKPEWSTAPGSATHLLKCTSAGGYAWGRRVGNRFFDALEGDHVTLWADAWEVVEARPIASA